MYSLLFLTAISSLLVVFLTPLVRYWFTRWKCVDAPGLSRKIHDRPIPRVGGVAIFGTIILSYTALFLIGLHGRSVLREGLPWVLRLLPALSVVFLTGLTDDLRGLKPYQKLAGQCLAASLAVWAGVRVQGFGVYRFNPTWAVAATLIWLILCTNAVNLIDGLDGLAAGIGLFATVTTLLAALLQHNVELAFATAPLAGALLGFLRYNFNPATIFLGDCGSLLIGFLLGCYGVLWGQKSATMLGMAAPLMVLSIPLLDTGLTVARRFLRRQPIFSADRGHIHHRLLDRGLTPRGAVL